MIDSLINIDFNKKAKVDYRTFPLVDPAPSSVNVNQVTGDFVVTFPSLNNGTVVLYPQSPNNPTTSLLGEIKTFTSFPTVGSISAPLDAKFDSIRSKIWIADTGNNRVIKLDYASLEPDLVIDITYPFCVIPNINTGGIFIRSYNNLIGYMNYYLSSGTIEDSFTYTDILPANYNSQCSSYDYRRNRLWYIGSLINNIYADAVIMIDFSNKQTSYIPLKYLSSDIESSAKMIEVDVDSGNAFVVGYDSNASRDYLFQIFRDNNVVLSKTYLPKSEAILDSSSSSSSSSLEYSSMSSGSTRSDESKSSPSSESSLSSSSSSSSSSGPHLTLLGSATDIAQYGLATDGTYVYGAHNIVIDNSPLPNSYEIILKQIEPDGIGGIAEVTTGGTISNAYSNEFVYKLGCSDGRIFVPTYAYSNSASLYVYTFLSSEFYQGGSNVHSSILSKVTGVCFDVDIDAGWSPDYGMVYCACDGLDNSLNNGIAAFALHLADDELSYHGFTDNPHVSSNSIHSVCLAKDGSTHRTFAGNVHVTANGYLRSYYFNPWVPDFTQKDIIGSGNMDTWAMAYDGTYLYTVTNDNLNAYSYSFSTDTFALITSTSIFGGGYFDVYCRGSNIYTLSINGEKLLIYTFDGATFTLKLSHQLPSRGWSIVVTSSNIIYINCGDGVTFSTYIYEE